MLSPASAGIAPTCAAGSASSHELPTCRSAKLFHRRSIFVRHLGSRPALGSRKGLCARNADVRPAMPRQGRLMCQARQAQTRNPFKRPREMDGMQKTLANLSGMVFYGAALLLITAAGALGYTAGSRAPDNYRQIGKGAGAVAFGAAATVAAAKGRETRGQAASVALYNDLMGRPDPGNITLSEVQQIGAKYGVDFNKTAVGDLQQIYNEFLTALIPTDSTPLTGDEPQQLRQFKDALGLENTAAAEVHMNLARQLKRESAESGKGDITQKKALGKLVYVSYLVFGAQQAAFVLPWKRVLDIQPATIDVMRRDNAKQLFQNYIKNNGGELQADEQFLRKLKDFKDRVQLSDEAAEEVFQEAARKKLERCLDTALEAIKKRTRVRDYTPAVKAIREALDYNTQLEQLASQEGVPKGIAKTNIYGTKFADSDKDMRDIFRVFVEESLRQDGKFSEQLERDVTGLQQALALGTNEASSLRDEISSKSYRRLLREEVKSGRLDAAQSKAGVLQLLCEQLKFNPEAAAALHRSLYRQKIDGVLEEKKKISDEDAKELDRQRRLLCIPKADIDTIQRETTGRIFQAAVEDALNAGIDRFSFDDRDNVKRSKKELRVSDALAKEILDRVTRKAFLQFVTRSRGQRDRLEAAKELKKMVFFSNIVVANLLDDIKGDVKEKQDKAEAAKKELAELMVQAQEAAKKEEAGATDAQAKADDLKEAVEAADKDAALEKEKEAALQEAATAASPADQPASLKKAENARDKQEDVGTSGGAMKSQKEINLADDLQLRDRQDIYRNFLLYCMSGDVVALPMGSTVTIERDTSEFKRLSELGDVLGLGQFDVAHVHRELAETAFRNQVTNVLQSGTLTKENTEYLSGMQEKLGLSKEQAEKIIKGVQNQRLLGGLEAAKNTGQLTLQKVLDMKESGVDVDSFISEELRLSLYAKEVQEVLSNGTGDLDEERLLHQLPKELSLSEKKVKRAVEDQAKDRKRTTLIQAISYYRQKKLEDTVKALNNLIACNKALPSEDGVNWKEHEELQDLFSVYIGKDHDSAKQQVLQKLFRLSDKDAQSLRNVVESGQFRTEAEDDDSSFF